MKASRDLEPTLIEMHKSAVPLEHAGRGLSDAFHRWQNPRMRVEDARWLFVRAIKQLSRSQRRIRRSREWQCSWTDFKNQIASWRKALRGE